MFRQLIAVTVCAVSLGTGIVAAQGRQGGGPPALSATPKSGESYLWHGEFVSFDGATRTLTVKARILPDVAAEVGRFNPGDKVLLTWSGLDIHAGAIRRITKYEAGQRIPEFFAMPATLGARDAQGDLITIRVQVPEAGAAAVKGMKPGAWVSITARQRPNNEADTVGVVGGYVKSQN